MSNFAYDKLLSVYTDNPMVKIPLERDVQNTLASVLDAYFKQLPDAEMDDMVDENYRLNSGLRDIYPQYSMFQNYIFAGPILFGYKKRGDETKKLKKHLW